MPLNNQGFFLRYFAYDDASSTGIARFYHILPFLWEVERPLVSLRRVRIKFCIDYLGVLMALKRNWSLRDIQQKLKFKFGPWSVGDDCLSHIRLADQKLLDLSLYLSPILFVGVTIVGIVESLVHYHPIFTGKGHFFNLFDVEQKRSFRLQFQMFLLIWQVELIWLRNRDKSSQKHEFNSFRKKHERLRKEILFAAIEEEASQFSPQRSRWYELKRLWFIWFDLVVSSFSVFFCGLNWNEFLRRSLFLF